MENNWYTQEEVAEKLGISKTTVYHYAKQKKIKKIPDPHRIHRFARYEKAEVDKLAEERQKHPEGYKPSEVAKELGMTVQSVLKHIRNGTIKAEQVPFGDERMVYVISPESLKDAKEKLAPAATNRIRKSEYYESSLDIALFQLFHSGEHHTARVTKDPQGNWGFYLTKYDKWVSYDEGRKLYQLSPVYEIHQPLIEPKGYVHFNIPYDEKVLYEFIDYLYKIWGVENVRVREHDSYSLVYIYVKSGHSSFEKVSFNLTEILPFITEGKLYTADDLIIFESTYLKTSIELPKKMRDKVKKLAEQEKITMSQWIEQAIGQVLASNHHDKYKI